MRPTKDFRINLYPKTTRGKRGYKRSSPRFIAISDWGYCLKWNSNVPPSEFYNVARRRLCDAIECGGLWTVAVLFNPDPNYKTPVKVFLEVRFTPAEIDKYYKIRQKRLDFLRKIATLKHRCMKSYALHTVTTTKEYLDFFEEQIKELFNVCPNQLIGPTDDEQNTTI